MWQNKKGLAKRGIFLLVCAVVVISLLSACGKQVTEVIATYKDGQVTRAEFDNFMNVNKFFDEQIQYFEADPAFQDQMLQQLIAFKILSSRAGADLRSDADQKVNEQLEELQVLADSKDGKGALKNYLKQANLKENDLKQYLQMSYYALSEAENKVSETQVKEDYDSIINEDPHAFDTATVRHILIMTFDPSSGEDLRTSEEALSRAKEVQDKLNKGGDFVALAKEYSDDEGSKDNGGQYADYPVSNWVPEFKQAVLELSLNQISEPVETDFGYHVMKVEARSTKTYDDIKGLIRTQIAYGSIYDFMETELPGLIETNLLKTEPGEADSSQNEPGSNTNTDTGN